VKGPVARHRVELDRATHALQLAMQGHRVVVVSSGDPGVFAMAAAVFEALEAGLRAFEAEQSEIRKTLFGHIDAFTAELVERYKSGAASVDALLDS
jgi:hypothetical protein